MRHRHPFHYTDPRYTSRWTLALVSLIFVATLVVVAAAGG